MAPAASENVEEALRDVIDRLYFLQVQVKDYQTGTGDAMVAEVKRLVQSLITLSHSVHGQTTVIPADIVEYVENGRNPDIYTRQFVELMQQRNQQMKGKSDAFAQFRDSLARELSGAVPSVRPEVEKILNETGDSRDEQ